ncbi:MAG: DoxX family protein [Planctomycetota bacterium]|nr:DoxX family protein [Planctomycetota bacterium]MDA1141467.1 DoxX family protein [Planctomycetota bacterium]
MKDESKQAVAQSLAILVGLIFLIFGISKLTNPPEFAQNIRNYRWDFLPAWFIRFGAVVLPWWEIAAGLAIFRSSWRRPACWMIGGMTTLFIVAVISALHRGLDIDCGCFGGGAKVGAKALALEIGILASVGAILRYCPNKEIKAGSDLDKSHNGDE